MRRSDPAAQRGTSISRPTPFPPGPRHPAAAPGGGSRPPLGTGAERRLVAALRDCGADPRIAGAVRVLGQAGEHGAVWMAAGTAGALADGGRRGAWLRATAVVAVAHAASLGAKRLVRRPRPRIPGAAPLVRTAGRLGFPSSHATSSAAAVVAFRALMPGAATVPVLAAAICVSRLVAGVHYPSDVACGALLGAAAARLGRGWALGPGAGGPWQVLPGAANAARHAATGAGAGSVAALAAHVLPGGGAAPAGRGGSHG